MKFLVDAQLPPGLAGWVTEKGHEATHVFDIFLTAAEDPEIWDHALESGLIIITKDEDFSERAYRERLSAPSLYGFASVMPQTETFFSGLSRDGNLSSSY